MLYCGLTVLHCAKYAPRDHPKVLIQLETPENTVIEVRVYNCAYQMMDCRSDPRTPREP